MERQPRTFDLSSLSLDDDNSIQTHPLKSLRTSKTNSDIINLHSKPAPVRLLNDVQRTSDPEQEKLKEKLSVQVNKEPLFEGK